MMRIGGPGCFFVVLQAVASWKDEVKSGSDFLVSYCFSLRLDEIDPDEDFCGSFW